MDRPTYHHGDLRNALADAATEHVRSGGPQALALREVAREVGVSPSAAYRHFSGHADLLATVAARARAGMGARMDAGLAALVRTGDPLTDARAGLRAVGRAYIEYALAEPGLFRVAFDASPPVGKDASPVGGDAEAGRDAPADGDDGCEDGPDPWRRLVERLDALDALGGLGPGGRPGADVVAWAAVHGLSVLLVGGPLAALPAVEREACLERLLDVVSSGLSGPVGAGRGRSLAFPT